MTSILVIDDDVDMAEATATVLRLDGGTVRVARNGREGLERLAEELPDVIVCDVEMPLLDGPGLALQMLLRDAGAERIPFVLVSAAPDLRAIAAMVGTPYFLSKPFTADQLMALTARASVERRAPQPPPTGAA